MEQARQQEGNAAVRVTKDCEDVSGRLQLLPCSIGHNGRAAVSTFFTPAASGETSEGLRVQKAAFRGRGLQGDALELPSNNCGYVLGKDSKITNRYGGFDEWQTLAQFRNMTYWNHDSRPSSSDPLPRCFDWLHLSEIIHGSISAEGVASMIAEQSSLSRGLKRKSSS
ncbi:hypothetical protein Mapa_015516 [Marchantia paleacea]|nr:hypothetical protein Mapa_015516 [Marchantia paleacea]